MTTAAAFRFAGGVMFCADGQITWGEGFKTSGSKIACSSVGGYGFVLTGAGHMDFMEWFFQRAVKLLDRSDKTIQSAESILDATVKQLYQEHVSPYSQRTGTSSGEVELLMAFVGTDKKLGFWQNSSTALLEADDCECVGTGAGAARFFVQSTYRPEMKDYEAVLVAVKLLMQAKRFDPYSGGDSWIFVLHSDGRVSKRNLNLIVRAENYLDGSNRAFVETMLKLGDLGLSGDELEAALQSFSQEMRSLRSELEGPTKVLREWFGEPGVRKIRAS